MKQIILLLSAVFLFSTSSFSQQKNDGKAFINTPGVHCDFCKKRIERYVSNQNGVTSVEVDLKKKVTTVTWLKDRVNIEDVKTYIANAGYDADDVMAEKTTYDRMPKECQVKTTPFDPE